MPEEPDNRNREQQVVSLLQAAARTERAPQSLRAQVEATRERAAVGRRRRATPRPAFRFLGAGTTAVAATVVALVLALGGAGAPSLAQAAAIANLRPAAPAPAGDPSDPTRLLTARVGTLHFPNWEAAGGWRAVGQRFDHIGNHTATTVYYANRSARVVYSILSSPALAVKATVVSPSVPTQTYTTLARQGRTTVVWQESGHTCLLTGSRGMSAAQLWQLAFYGFRRPLA